MHRMEFDVNYLINMHAINYSYYLKTDSRIQSRSLIIRSAKKPTVKDCVRAILKSNEVTGDVAVYGDPTASVATQVFVAVTAITPLDFCLASKIVRPRKA